MPGIIAQLIGQKHVEKMQNEQYKLESARSMIQEEAKNPGTYNPAMIQMAADTLKLGIVPKEHEGHFHRALGAVLPHLFGSKKPDEPANGGAMSSGGSAAPAMAPPPTDPNTTTLNYGGMPSLPAPPTEPLPASGQAGSGPAVPSDTQAPPAGPSIASAPSAGFTSLTPPPGSMLRNGPSVPFHVNTLDERVQANAPGMRAKATVERQIAAEDLAAKQAALEKIPAFADVLPRQQLTLLTGQALSPEVRRNIPGYSLGEEAPAGTLDVNKHPVASGKFYRKVETESGTQWHPEPAITQKRVIPDRDSITGFSEVWEDKTGREVSRTSGATPPVGYVPQTSSTSSSSVKMVPQADGSIAAVPVTSSSSTTRQRVMPGASSAPSGSIPPPPGAPRKVGQVPAGAGTPGRTIGQTTGMTRMKAENPLTPQAQAQIEDTEPKLAAISRLKKALEPFKGDNTPFATLLPRIAYAVGVDPKDMGGFLSQLELNRIGSAARLLKGTSRSGTILEKAMIHTPDAWKDSGKLMYGKLTEIETALKDIMTTVQKNGQRYPGLNQGMTPPPGAPRTADEYLKSIGR